MYFLKLYENLHMHLFNLQEQVEVSEKLLS